MQAGHARVLIAAICSCASPAPQGATLEPLTAVPARVPGAAEALSICQTAATDMKQLVVRLEQLFAAYDVHPAITRDASTFVAEHDLSIREIDGGAYLIDRRPNHSLHTMKAEVPGPTGFKIKVQELDLLPQIATQYVAPPSPRGGRLQTFSMTAANTHALLANHRVWVPNPAHQPYLYVELVTGADLNSGFVDDILDCIQRAK